MSGRHPGKRLSPVRVAFGALVGLAVLTGAAAVPWYFTHQTHTVTEDAGPRWYGGYFDVTAADVKAAPTTGDGSADSVVLSFIVASSSTDCTPSWGGYYGLAEAGSELDLDRRIDGMRRDGAHVAVSFGGALNTELAAACTTVSGLVRAYSAVIDRYSVTTIDIDLENSNLDDSVAGERRAVALAQLQREQPELKVWLTLPTAVNGLTDRGIAAVRQLLDAGVTLAGVNAMTMDYGTDLGRRSMAAVSIDALNAVHSQLTSVYEDLRIALPAGGAWAVMGATAMIGQNDIADEVFTLKDAAELNAFATKTRLARLSIWSSNRDRTCGPNYPDVSVVSDSCSGVDQGSKTFAGVMAAGFDGAPSDESTPLPSSTPLPDDPTTSPYPIWSEDGAYSAGVRVVHDGYVYVAKWWVSGGPDPDDPTQSADSTSWVLVGPVMPDDRPYVLPTVAPGTYPDWTADAVYQKGARVVLNGVPYEAKWWTQGDDPAFGITDHDRSPWKVVEE